ncbi:MAG TPA: stage II sporulation protein M, partial [Armatimonadota bacterium]|nr:stage II sporulation protein M [Armatimonadota bacterium]
MPVARTTDINQFLNRRQDQWRRLEVLLQRVEGGGLGGLSVAEVREFGILYRRASSDLVTARAKTANAEVLEYL